MLTAESATLNTGHHCTSIQSTTRPPMNPEPARKARSMRLPSAPPATSPIATAPKRLRAVGPVNTRVETTTSARTAIHGPRFQPSPTLNAAPSLNARLSCSDPTSSMILPPLSRWTAQVLDSWSTMTTAAAVATTSPRRRGGAVAVWGAGDGASGSATAQPTDLVLDPLTGPRDRFQALLRDGLA